MSQKSFVKILKPFFNRNSIKYKNKWKQYTKYISYRCTSINSNNIIHNKIKYQSLLYKYNNPFNININQKRNIIGLPSNDDEDANMDFDSSMQNKTVDIHVIFEIILNELIQKYGEKNMIFPKNITWLSGAPGSGKGEMTSYIMQKMDIQAPPILLSHLLIGPEIEKIKSQGKLVSDRHVLKVLLEKLLDPMYSKGVVIDGFPRTECQAKFIGILFDKMLHFRRKYINESSLFRRPVFHITVLYVDEDKSIERQLKRGDMILEHNKRVDTTGVGNKHELRDTDLNEEKARERYKYFKEHVYQSLQLIKNKFPFHFINAEGTLDDVKQKIQDELQYQSQNELGDDTYEMVKQFPLAAEIRTHGRHELVSRLDRYTRENKELMQQVIELLKTDFLRIIKQQALSGHVKIRSNASLLRDNPEALTMMLDILSERGYKVILDVSVETRPIRVDLKTGKIINIDERVFTFDIGFPSPQIRHATQTYQWDASLN